MIALLVGVEGYRVGTVSATGLHRAAQQRAAVLVMLEDGPSADAPEPAYGTEAYFAKEKAKKDAEAAVAARRCTELAPAAAMGHYRLGVALRGLGPMLEYRACGEAACLAAMPVGSAASNASGSSAQRRVAAVGFPFLIHKIELLRDGVRGAPPLPRRAPGRQLLLGQRRAAERRPGRVGAHARVIRERDRRPPVGRSERAHGPDGGIVRERDRRPPVLHLAAEPDDHRCPIVYGVKGAAHYTTAVCGLSLIHI